MGDSAETEMNKIHPGHYVLQIGGHDVHDMDVIDFKSYDFPLSVTFGVKNPVGDRIQIASWYGIKRGYANMQGTIVEIRQNQNKNKNCVIILESGRRQKFRHDTYRI